MAPLSAPGPGATLTCRLAAPTLALAALLSLAPANGRWAAGGPAPLLAAAALLQYLGPGAWRLPRARGLPEETLITDKLLYSCSLAASSCSIAQLGPIKGLV